MGRRLRIEYEGAIYHVIQRGNNREFIFERATDKEYLIEQMNQAVQMDGVQIFAYVVMNNHYHIALRTQEKPISQVMHRINSRFSHHYNRERERTGHVFESRYKAIPVENENYLLTIIRYIHRNPVQAQLCQSVSDFRWSSDKAYRGQEQTFIETKFLLGLLAENPYKALDEYDILMGMDDDYRWKDSIFIGSPSFTAQFEPQKPISVKFSLQNILSNTGATMDDITLIRNGSKQRKIMSLKKEYVQTAINQGYTMDEIGKYVGISGVAVGKMLQSIRQQSQKVRK